MPPASRLAFLEASTSLTLHYQPYCIINKYCAIWYCKCDAVQCDEMKINKLNWSLAESPLAIYFQNPDLLEVKSKNTDKTQILSIRWYLDYKGIGNKRYIIPGIYSFSISRFKVKAHGFTRQNIPCAHITNVLPVINNWLI